MLTGGYYTFTVILGKKDMQLRQLHSWDLTYAEARTLQIELAGEVKQCRFRPKKKMLVAGLDCAFSKDAKRVIAAVVVLQLPGFEIIEQAWAIKPVTFPYIPGLLSFREGPACIAAVEKLSCSPDVFIVDGQGIAHPRRLGIAAHLGIIFDTPTIGCAKSRLTGRYDEPGIQKGEYALLFDKVEIIGAVLRTRNGVKPVFVSVGNKCTLDDAIKTSLLCCTGFRLPEPTRLAHQIVTKLKTDPLTFDP